MKIVLNPSHFDEVESNLKKILHCFRIFSLFSDTPIINENHLWQSHLKTLNMNKSYDIVSHPNRCYHSFESGGWFLNEIAYNNFLFFSKQSRALMGFKASGQPKPNWMICFLNAQSAKSSDFNAMGKNHVWNGH